MAKRDKQKRKKTEKTRNGGLSGMDATMARRMMEKDMAVIEKLISEREFKSEDELNKFLQKLVSSGELDRLITRRPLAEAQELVYDAWETPSIKEKVKLARKALEIYPNCADAYVILAEETALNMEEALKLYQAGVEAGERALGAKTFKEDVGHFWGLLETRPYMRARAGLAQCLSALGRQKEAVEHYRDMLRLNPNDNQGIRYLLAACLLEIGELDALKELLGRYDGATAAWLYTGALVAFLEQGDSPEARRRLLKAMKYNRYVPPYLLGEKALPKQLPEYMSFGDRTEAIIYAAEFGLGWLKARGAIAWLGSVYRNRPTVKRRRSKPPEIPEVFLRAFESD